MSSAGGHAVVAKYGRAYMRKLARKSGGGRPRLRTLAEIEAARGSGRVTTEKGVTRLHSAGTKKAGASNTGPISQTGAK